MFSRDAYRNRGQGHLYILSETLLLPDTIWVGVLSYCQVAAAFGLR